MIAEPPTLTTQYSDSDQELIDNIQAHIDNHSKNLLSVIDGLDATTREKYEAYINDRALIRLHQILAGAILRAIPERITIINIKRD